MTELLRLWLELYTRDGKNVLQSFFYENNIKKVAIYGGGTLGNLFHNEAKKHGICVELCIDKKLTDFNGIRVRKSTNLNESDFDGIDLIVICLSYDIDIIIKELSKITCCHIIALDEIIHMCVYKQLYIPFCNKQNIRPYIISYPYQVDLECLSASEELLSYVVSNPEQYRNNPKYFKELYKFVPEYNDEYINNVFTQSPVIEKGRMLVHSDMATPYVNIIQNIRFSPFLPELFNNTIHLIGHCDVLGFGVDDSRTISSLLQKRLRSVSEKNSSKYRVLNHGVWGFVRNDFMRAFDTLKGLTYCKGDIVVITIERPHRYRPYLFDYYNKVINISYPLYNNLYREFNEFREMPLFIDHGHLSYYGMKRVADILYKLLSDDGLLGEYDARLGASQNNFDYSAESLKDISVGSLHENKEFREYIESLQSHKKQTEGISGAIVMNCNPFTKGHRYLIEMALSKVDNLFVFVVEEDKSAFTFQDRINMVRDGTKDLDNVVVLPSGKYIISSITFPEYFIKDQIQEISIDTSKDIEIFAKYIAPTLNITKRFVGEEPLDIVTRQYNQTMKEILPPYGIELVEFARYAKDGQVISASFVRDLIKNNNYKELNNYIPTSTFKYLH